MTEATNIGRPTNHPDEEVFFTRPDGEMHKAQLKLPAAPNKRKLQRWYAIDDEGRSLLLVRVNAKRCWIRASNGEGYEQIGHWEEAEEVPIKYLDAATTQFYPGFRGNR